MSKKISEKILYKGRWITLKESTHLNREEKEIKWESVERNQKQKVLTIIPKFKYSDNYILIKQYRAATANYVIGFPAGVSETDNYKEEALRELKEETGYTGTVAEISPTIKLAGIINESMKIVHVEVDETDPVNNDPKQSLEPSEEIEVLIKRKDEIKNFLLQEKNKGYEIGVGPWYVFGIK